MVLFVKHIAIEGPETLGTFFSSRGIPFREVDLSAGEPLPEDVSGLKALVVLGGPMNVYEEDRYPFLRQEDIFIRKALAARIPFLGICLGSQLLAKACGARVEKARQKEIGWYRVDLTDEGRGDPLFCGMTAGLDVYQWHEDTFVLPPGGILLATSLGCPHQAFRVGKNAYGLQFHVEITDRSIRDWSRAYFDPDNPGHGRQREDMLAQYRGREKRFHFQAEKIYNNFSEIIHEAEKGALRDDAACCDCPDERGCR